MKTEGEIHHKLQQVRFRHLKKELEARLSEHPVNCKHFTELKACQLQNAPCSQPPGRPAACGVFEQANDKDELKAGMKEFFLTRPAAEIAARFPDVAALMWVLDGSAPAETFFEEFREEELRAQVTQVQDEADKVWLELNTCKEEAVRLKAALYDRESATLVETIERMKKEEEGRSALLRGYVEEATQLRAQVAALTVPQVPWHVALYRRIFK